ncbi:MAG: SAM-dependent chlorinase/fluorinase [Candidatus Omnitrophica bacterium]|nr:SAM-dependent chlorinase/fluorinase [Candidatus Omnitrophota bacterium]
MNRPIGLLSDFGLRDHYVGSLKSVILKINPEAILFDLTHDIRPQNIHEGAFVLNAIYRVLPPQAIVVAVVDPGVGSDRQAICVKTKHSFLIAPNNGILHFALQNEKSYEIRAITNERYFHLPVSSTFHGRDIFAPVAAHLSRKDIFSSLGPRIQKIKPLPIPKARRAGKQIHGEVIYLDRFGNAMTNINRGMITSPNPKRLTVRAKRKFRALLKPFFGAGEKGKLIALWNSGELLELAVREDSAQKRYGLRIGDPVLVQSS